MFALAKSSTLLTPVEFPDTVDMRDTSNLLPCFNVWSINHNNDNIVVVVIIIIITPLDPNAPTAATYNGRRAPHFT